MQSITQQPVKAGDLAKISPLKLQKRGADKTIARLTDEHMQVPEGMIFTSTPACLEKFVEIDGLVAIVPDELWPKLSTKFRESQWVFSCKSINLAMAYTLSLFDARRAKLNPHIHKDATIDPSAQIGENVTVEPFAFIGANAKVGRNTFVGANVSINESCEIGENCILHSGCVIESNCVLGKRVEIHANTTIGSDGFGYADHPEKKGEFLKIPQIGRVVLEDDVEVGGNCSIDRATIGETRIGRGTKIDNLVHIAHNCQVGPDSRLTAGFMMAGSSKIGHHFVCGGGVRVTDHVTITDNVAVAGKFGITNDVLQPGAYGGYPLEPLKDSLKTLVNQTKIGELRKQVKQIRDHLGLKFDEKK